MTEEELIERVAQLELIVKLAHYTVCPMVSSESLNVRHLATATMANEMIHEYMNKWDVLETVEGSSRRFNRWTNDSS